MRASELQRVPYLKKIFLEKIAVEESFQLGGISYGVKGLDLKDFLGWAILKIEIFNAFLFTFLIGRGPRAAMTRECIPILFLTEF